MTSVAERLHPTVHADLLAFSTDGGARMSATPPALTFSEAPGGSGEGTVGCGVAPSASISGAARTIWRWTSGKACMWRTPSMPVTMAGLRRAAALPRPLRMP
ncbi:MAG: hypothetical protein ACYDBQ_12290 [Thermoplasmatota archaeon]